MSNLVDQKGLAAAREVYLDLIGLRQDYVSQKAWDNFAQLFEAYERAKQAEATCEHSWVGNNISNLKCDKCGYIPEKAVSAKNAHSSPLPELPKIEARQLAEYVFQDVPALQKDLNQLITCLEAVYKRLGE